MEIRLRRFFPSDLEKILEIEKLSFPDRKAWSKEYFKIFYLNYPEGFIVAENEKEIIGYAIARPKNDSAEIFSLAVASNWRKKGVGKTLTNYLINHFQEKNIKKVFVRVRTKNQAAINFYQKLGFEISKKIKNYYQNGDDAYLIKKKMGG